MTVSVSKFETGLRFVAFVLFAIVGLAVIHPATARAEFEWARDMDFYQDKDFTITVVKTHPTQQVIRIHGNIVVTPWSLKTALKVLKNIDPRKEIILDLSGYGGGYLFNAEEIVPSIKSVCESKRNRNDPRQSCNVTTWVDSSAACSSSCIIPYMAGKKRVACDQSEFGFHSVALLGFKMSSDHGVSMLLQSGVFKSWIMRNIKMFQTLDVTFLRPHQMVGSNIVTDLIKKCDYTDDVVRTAYEYQDRER
jgi:Predicted periplasmic protein